jgi:hypothetical protein
MHSNTSEFDRILVTSIAGCPAFQSTETMSGSEDPDTGLPRPSEDSRDEPLDRVAALD